MHPANSNYEMHLNSGRKIVLEEIHQHLTYAGLLESNQSSTSVLAFPLE